MEDMVIVYIDNIMIFTKGSLAEHQAKVKEVLQWLRDNNLFACLEKKVLYQQDRSTVTSKTVAMFGDFGVSDV